MEAEMLAIESMEANVRSYVRSFPTVFMKAKGATLMDMDCKSYIDFFSGAGVLNYGHNNDVANTAMVNYIQSEGIMHGLDMATSAKADFLRTFNNLILKPRGMSHYKVQFSAPTGTNSVESALKVARKATGRKNIINFKGGFHGMTLGALELTTNPYYHDEAYPETGTVSTRDFVPFGDDAKANECLVDLAHWFEFLKGANILPAAIIIEVLQGEGGVRPANVKWIQGLRKLTHDYGVVMIVDEIQTGNGRLGTYFGFDRYGIRPDIITLSKSLGGGLPIALTIYNPELDVLKPGEHSGTFRGNNLAFVAATALLKHYWDEELRFIKYASNTIGIMESALGEIERAYKHEIKEVRGAGALMGIEFKDKDAASNIAAICFKRGLVIETAGEDNEVLKFMPPLTASTDELNKGFSIVLTALAEYYLPEYFSENQE